VYLPRILQSEDSPPWRCEFLCLSKFFYRWPKNTKDWLLWLWVCFVSSIGCVTWMKELVRMIWWKNIFEFSGYCPRMLFKVLSKTWNLESR
jgi:hypothetical protein